jgi:undecaprenyl-diphosphatase
MNEIIIQILLGIVQGITEWLPISSSAALTLINTNFLKILDIDVLIRNALLLHLGTFFAAMIYFRKDIWMLLKGLANPDKAGPSTKKVLVFLIVSTIISGIVGILIFKTIISFQSQLEITRKSIMFFVGILLFLTGIIQIKVKTIGVRSLMDLKIYDAVIVGFCQGLAAIPGLSRSGITVSTLLLNKFDDTTALRLSFLMSLPIVLIANIVLNYNQLTFSNTAIYGLVASFVFGLLTIHGLMKLSKKINFGWFVILFSILMILGVLI